jgi:hypothetical protein
MGVLHNVVHKITNAVELPYRISPKSVERFVEYMVKSTYRPVQSALFMSQYGRNSTSFNERIAYLISVKYVKPNWDT